MKTNSVFKLSGKIGFKRFQKYEERNFDKISDESELENQIFFSLISLVFSEDFSVFSFLCSE